MSLIMLIDRYLRLCERRNLVEASSLLATGAQMEFPGGRVFHSLNEMVSDSALRYRRVTKHPEMYFEGTRREDGADIVVSVGTLDGESLAGNEFEGVRYLDWFAVVDGLITEQRVFNDLADHDLDC